MFSKSCQDLIQQMISVDPADRPTIFEVLAHPWMQQSFDLGASHLVYSEMKARKEFITLQFR